MATGAFVVWASIAFLAVNMMPAIEGSVVLKRLDERVPHNVPSLDPIPAGSITALAPMPKIKSPPVVTQASFETAATPDAVPAEAALADRRKVVDGVNVRRDASSRSAVIGTLAPGESVRVVESRRGWRLVEYKSGIRGWVYGRYLTQAATVAAAD